MSGKLLTALFAGSVVAVAAPAAQALDIHGAPLPPGAKADADRWLSPRSFRDTVDYYRHELSRRGASCQILPPEKFRDVVYVRILAQDSTLGWSAIHVVLADSKTTIYIVAPPAQPASVTRGSSNGRTTDSESVYLGSNPSPRTLKVVLEGHSSTTTTTR